MKQSLVSFGFIYILFFSFSLSCFVKSEWRKPAENIALVDVGWRQEHIYFVYLPVFPSEALRQTS